MNTAHQRQDYDSIREQLKLKTFQLQQSLAKKHEHLSAEVLNKTLDINALRQKSGHLISAGALAGAFLLAPTINANPLPQATEVIAKAKTADAEVIPQIAPQKVLIDTLNQLLPQKPRPLTVDEEKQLEQAFNDVLSVDAKATLEGEHLNTAYGYIGAEQHLMRYPGDTMATHPTVAEDDEGMAPGRGAWGYFAASKSELTDDLIEKEKWYAVVQTLYLPDWNTRTKYLRDWYKYRKVLIVNTTNGNAVVADIADSGPAMWTGKSFGGSPEVMNYLGGPRYKKGPVVVFFIDDPDNKVPLGPVEYNKIDLPEWAFHQV